jgi:hypothetical protein
MPTRNNGSSKGSTRGKKSNDTAVAQAIDDLVNAGFAIIDREVESCPILYLLSGEIFMFGSDYVTRIW